MKYNLLNTYQGHSNHSFANKAFSALSSPITKGVFASKTFQLRNSKWEKVDAANPSTLQKITIIVGLLVVFPVGFISLASLIGKKITDSAKTVKKYPLRKIKKAAKKGGITSHISKKPIEADNPPSKKEGTPSLPKNPTIFRNHKKPQRELPNPFSVPISAEDPLMQPAPVSIFKAEKMDDDCRHAFLAIIGVESDTHLPLTKADVNPDNYGSLTPEKKVLVNKIHYLTQNLNKLHDIEISQWEKASSREEKRALLDFSIFTLSNEPNWLNQEAAIDFFDEKLQALKEKFPGRGPFDKEKKYSVNFRLFNLLFSLDKSAIRLSMATLADYYELTEKDYNSDSSLCKALGKYTPLKTALYFDIASGYFRSSFNLLPRETKEGSLLFPEHPETFPTGDFAKIKKSELVKNQSKIPANAFWTLPDAVIQSLDLFKIPVRGLDGFLHENPSALGHFNTKDLKQFILKFKNAPYFILDKGFSGLPPKVQLTFFDCIKELKDDLSEKEITTLIKTFFTSCKNQEAKDLLPIDWINQEAPFVYKGLEAAHESVWKDFPLKLFKKMDMEFLLKNHPKFLASFFSWSDKANSLERFETLTLTQQVALFKLSLNSYNLSTTALLSFLSAEQLLKFDLFKHFPPEESKKIIKEMYSGFSIDKKERKKFIHSFKDTQKLDQLISPFVGESFFSFNPVGDLTEEQIALLPFSQWKQAGKNIQPLCQELFSRFNKEQTNKRLNSLSKENLKVVKETNFIG